MAWFGLRNKQKIDAYETPIAKKWYEEENAFNPRPGRKYDWVWQYAQFQYSRAEENRRSTDEKSITVLKFALSLAAFVWAVFEFVNSRPIGLTPNSKIIAGLAALPLIASAILAIVAFKPKRYLRALDERKVLEYADGFTDEQQAMAKCFFGLASSTEARREILAKKMKFLLYAMWLLVVSVVCFIFSAVALAIR